MYKVRTAVLLIVVFILGITLTINGVSDLIKLNGNVPDFNFDSVADVKKDGFVQGYVANIMDCYASETTTNTTMGIETSSRTSGEYFIMPLINEADSDNELYVTITSKNEGNRAMLNRICDVTWEYMDGKEVKFPEMYIVARVKKLDPELKEYMTEWFETTEWYDSRAEIDKHILPYEFVVYNTSGVYTGLIVGIVILAVYAAVIVFLIHRYKAKKIPQYEQSYSMPQSSAGTVSGGDNTAASGAFGEQYAPPPPQPIPNIPQPVQYDEFFGDMQGKREKAAEEPPASEPVPQPAEQPAATAFDPDKMDELDTSALNVGAPEDYDNGFEFDSGSDFGEDSSGSV